VFDFLKMDKNKCPNFENKNTLTEKKICLDKIFLSSQIKPFFLFFIMIFFEKNLKIKSIATLMETLGNNFVAKSGNNQYHCEKCDYVCSKKYNWEKHLSTSKHQMEPPGNILETENGKKWQQNFFTCENCNKTYKNRSGLWKHKQKCDGQQHTTQDKVYLIDKDEPSDKQLIMMLIKENSELRKEQADIKEIILEIVKNGTTNHSHNTTNSHNKAFNLQFFLNETCKNAMNITDFVESIKLQLSDFMSMGEVGFVEGISNIIVKNLNSLDETIRPIHCTDQKRETFYVKDENKWEKEEADKKKMKKMIKSIAYKNEKLMKTYKETYPDYNNPDSRRSDQYSKIMIEAMDSKDDSREKIIKKISKATAIEKK
jgi:hypothetical protein